ncbi:hypothetical protein BH10ACT1_BH10ACT1_24290 [soil metagenome]
MPPEHLPPPPDPPSAALRPGPPPNELIVDLTLGRRQLVPFLVAVVVFLGFAVLCGTAVAGAPWPGNAGLAVVAALLLLAVYGMFRVRKRIFAPRSLVFDGRGIRQVAVDRRAFALEWAEVAQARVSYARKPGTIRSPLTWGGITEDAAPGQDPAASFGVSTFVRLDLVPADAAFLDRHPELKPFKRWTDRPAGTPKAGAPWAEDVGGRQAIIRIPFGDMPQLAAATDAAIQAFAGSRYHPPVNEGLAWGFRYS